MYVDTTGLHRLFGRVCLKQGCIISLVQMPCRPQPPPLFQTDAAQEMMQPLSDLPMCHLFGCVVHEEDEEDKEDEDKEEG